MKPYNHISIEKKWQEKWQALDLYRAEDFSDREKFYCLIEFPYPSGDGLHTGHLRSYTALDIIARKKRMQGYNVLFPIGWDAFGLPTENYAIKMKKHPRDVTKKNVEIFTKQIKRAGISFDWSREINTSDPKYYRWTQWIFLQLFKHGLAYKKKMPINWCPSCKIGLANEEVIDGKCERCGAETEKRDKEQWMLKITQYADRLIDDLKSVDYLEKIKTQQINWIGRSEGALLSFLVPRFQEILLASNNPSKKERIVKLLQGAGICCKIYMPKELGLDVLELKENGGLDENAKEKARAYEGKVDMPILGVDSGFFIKGEDIDPVSVKRNALGGQDEHSLSQEEIAERMVDYYRGLARRNGGEVDAYWRDSLALILPNGKIQMASSQREVVLTDKVKGKIDQFFPIRALYRVKATGKYTAEQTDEEELKELAPVTEALKSLLCERLEVFTTRPDTLFGATYIVLAPEHKFIGKFESRILNLEEVKKYINDAKKKSDIERTVEDKDKTGVELKGLKAINPATNKEIPIFVADYVLSHYGTGAIMAVPAHDQRDWEFAKKFNLDIVEVVSGGDIEKEAYVGDGILINSDFLNGLRVDDAIKKMIEWLEEKGVGKKSVNYKLRDWIFSRQHYWGEPIPMVECGKCGWVPVSEKDLPVELPEVEHYEPTDTGESPLASMDEWVNTICPKCGAPAKRETDTMPNWAGSSWYFLRYIDPDNNHEFADFAKLKYWLPVDLYNGGMEHTTLHLLYSRFWHKFLYDIGKVPTPEPYHSRRSHGMVLALDGQKMSKSRGNVINPDEVIQEYGADTLRLYEMFMGPYTEAIAWSTKGLVGVRRFLEKVMALNERVFDIKPTQEIDRLVHKTIKKVSEDIDCMKFNTAVASLMILVNDLYKLDRVPLISYLSLIILLSPFAPHLSEEIWERLGNKKSIFLQKWPEYDPAKVQDERFELVIQVNGRVRDSIEVEVGISEEQAKELALSSKKVKKWLKGNKPKRLIYVQGKLVNVVV